MLARSPASTDTTCLTSYRPYPAANTIEHIMLSYRATLAFAACTNSRIRGRSSAYATQRGTATVDPARPEFLAPHRPQIQPAKGKSACSEVITNTTGSPYIGRYERNCLSILGCPRPSVGHGRGKEIRRHIENIETYGMYGT